MNESVKKWLEEKRAELAGRRDVAIFIEAKDVLDAIEQLSNSNLSGRMRIARSRKIRTLKLKEEEPEKQDKISPKTQAWMALLDGLVGLDV